MNTRNSKQSTLALDATGLACVLIAALSLRIWLFYGLVGSDDSHYAMRGLEVAAGAWLPSDYIGDLRYGMNLPIALSVLLFGHSEAVLSVWGLVCGLSEIALVYVFALRAWGLRAALLSSLLLSVTPLAIDAATNIWADQPFSFLLTASALSLYWACSGTRALPYVFSGAILGLAAWVKPEPSVIFATVIALLALVFSDRKKQALAFLALGAGAIVLANLLLFSIAFGDPLYYWKLGTRNLQTNFVGQIAPWGTHSPFFYFRLLFLDGRAFWLIPFLSIGGVIVALRRAKTDALNPGLFVIVWAAFLLCAFSFFVYSISPLRLVPKQTNYALMFAAPLCLLGGVWLATASIRIRMPVLAITVLGAITLTILDRFEHDIRSWSHRLVIEFARSAPDTTVYASKQTIAMNRVFDLLGSKEANNLHPLAELRQAKVERPETRPSAGHVVLAFHPKWPEARKQSISDLVTTDPACVREVLSLSITPDQTTRVALEAVAKLRSLLPPLIDKHLAFTDPLLTPAPLRFFELSCH
ncbi:MAG: glycosyltransferase family 39 protein [Rhodocyclaceae bacterium]|nr:glycosyltransferase family 39 protein [Rhodocyclaceae bacterium]